MNWIGQDMCKIHTVKTAFTSVYKTNVKFESILLHLFIKVSEQKLVKLKSWKWYLSMTLLKDFNILKTLPRLHKRITTIQKHTKQCSNHNTKSIIKTLKTGQLNKWT